MVEGGEEFYNIINGLAQTDNFKRSIDRLPDTAIEQKGDEELVLRFFAVKNFIGGYHGNVQEWLDSYMEHVLFRKVDFDIASETKAFERIFHIIYDKFGSDAFARYRDGQPQGRLAPAYYEAVVGALVTSPEIVAQKASDQLRSSLAALFESAEFREVTGPGANTIFKLRQRIELVKSALIVNSAD